MQTSQQGHSALTSCWASRCFTLNVFWIQMTPGSIFKHDQWVPHGASCSTHSPASAQCSAAVAMQALTRQEAPQQNVDRAPRVQPHQDPQQLLWQHATHACQAGARPCCQARTTAHCACLVPTARTRPVELCLVLPVRMASPALLSQQVSCAMTVAACLPPRSRLGDSAYHSSTAS